MYNYYLLCHDGILIIHNKIDLNYPCFVKCTHSFRSVFTNRLVSTLQYFAINS